MPKAEIKTKETGASVDEFLDGIADDEQRTDAKKIVKIMQRITGDKPKMWGHTIVGFGNRVYVSPATGREVDWMKIGFSPRKGSLSLYVLNGSRAQAKLLEKLGKHKTGKGCLYVKRLSGVDENILEKVISSAFKKLL